MLTISKIPKEVYYTACEYENIPIKIEQLERSKEIYYAEVEKRRYTDGGLEKAIYDYMTLQRNFSENDGIFYDVNGYTIEM